MKKELVKTKGIKQQIMTKNFILTITAVIILVTSAAVIGRKALLNSSSELLALQSKLVKI